MLSGYKKYYVGPEPEDSGMSWEWLVDAGKPAEEPWKVLFPDTRLVRELTASAIACGDRRRVASGQARVASPLVNLQALSDAQRELFDWTVAQQPSS